MGWNSERRIQTSAGELTLCTLASVKDMEMVLELQREIWGYGQPGADFPYPVRALFALAESGGHVAVAYLNGTPVGLSVAWIGMFPESRRAYLHSQLMGVVGRHRYLGIGYQLKLYQRDFAIEKGLDLVRWTFDPMRSANANLNVRKLGVVVQTYYPDYYGDLRSNFNPGLATDRVWAEWYVASGRVKKRLAAAPALVIEKPPLKEITFLRETEAGCKELFQYSLEKSDRELLVEIPDDFDEICRKNVSLARDWQMKIRTLLQHYLGRGYMISDFLILPHTPRRVFYLLVKESLPKLHEM